MGVMRCMSCCYCSPLRDFDLIAAAEILAGKGHFRFQNLRVGALKYDFSASGAVAGAQVNDLVRCADHAGLVFDDDYGVARIAQLREQADKAFRSEEHTSE